jgi:hypothetical protein
MTLNQRTLGCHQWFPKTELSYSQVIHMLAVVVSANRPRIKIHPTPLKKKVTSGLGKKFHLSQIKSCHIRER